MKPLLALPSLLALLVTAGSVAGLADEETETPAAERLSSRDLYLGQDPPSYTPELFAPGIVSTDEHEFGSVFSADGSEFFYGVDVGGRSETRSIVFEDGAWGEPSIVIAHPTYGFNDPFLSPDGERLYVISDSPHSGTGPKKDHDIWYAIREDGGWSDPVPAGPNINSEFDEYYISFTREGDLYFGSNRADNDFDLYVSAYVDGEHQPAERLAGDVNTPHYEADVFVAPDASYLILCSRRPEGLGAGDLYISFRDSDGSWSAAQNMGEPVNSARHELCPFVTPDGDYFLFTSGGDIYWVDAMIVEDYR